MALDRLFGRVVEIAKSLSQARASQPPPPLPPLVEAEEVPIESARTDTPLDAEDAEIVGASSDEPLPTRTMARILAAQGHRRRALHIYETLLAAVPEDADLEREAERVRQDLAVLPAPTTATPADEAPVMTLVVDPSTVVVAWQLEELDVARAARIAEGGELRARLVVVAPDPADVVRIEVRERAVERMGEWMVAGLPAGALVTASVGLGAGPRFVSVAHTAVTALRRSA